MEAWQLQDAKNRFSEVVKRAREDGPQTVTVHGQPAPVVVSAPEFDRLTKPLMSFVDFLLAQETAWPDDVVDTINDRSTDTGRNLDI